MSPFLKSACGVLPLLRSPDPQRPDTKVKRFDVRHLHRWPLGTSYSDITDAVVKMFAEAPLAGSVLVVDATGVGLLVVHALKKARISARLRPLLITYGHTAHEDADGVWRVPKRDLVAVVRMALESRTLHVAKGLREAKTLNKELANFRVRITKAANETFGAGEEWREGSNDDLVLSTAAALWMAERAPVGFTPLPPNPATLNVGEILARKGAFGKPRPLGPPW
jgi:hypothetical protein